MSDLTFFIQRRWPLWLAACGLLALSACASVYRVDNQVQSFARWDSASAPAAPQSYHFERLPSQREGDAAASHDALENMAQVALARVGWSLAQPAASAPWTVQVAVDTLRLPRPPWEDRWGGFGYTVSGHLVMGVGEPFWGSGLMRMDRPYYERKLSVVIRQTASHQVVFETRAAHDGVWHGTPELWGAMLDAALRDFPAPPAGERQVNIDLPR